MIARSEFSLHCSKILITQILLVIIGLNWSGYGISRVSAIIPLNSTMLMDLQYNSPTFLKQIALWAVTGNTSASIHSLCGDEYLLGGYNILNSSASLTRTYSSLPTHKSVYITLSFWCIDEWRLSNYVYISISNDTYQFAKEDMGYLIYNSTSWPANVCGAPSLDVTNATLNIQSEHIGPDLILKIELQDSTNNFFRGQLGLRNIKILLSNKTIATPNFCAHTVPANLFQPYRRCACPSQTTFNSSDGSCQPCHGSCSTCFGPSETECFSCRPGRTYDGRTCNLCDSSCETCFGPLSTQCLTCPDGKSLTWNNTCQSTCDSGLVTVETGGYAYCRCSNYNYYYFNVNGSCLSSCLSPPVFTLESGFPVNLCHFKCNQGMYLYSNGSCLSDCQTNYTQVNEGGYKYCNFPCASTEFLYWNGSCLPSCSPPLVQETGPGYQHCIYPCNQAQYLISWNGSCFDSCDTPYNIRLEGNRNFCDLPCATSAYLFEDGFCIPSCISPLIQTINVTVRACKRPCSTTSIYYYPDETPNCKSSCPAPYVYNTTDLSMSCTLQLTATEVKQVQSINSVNTAVGGVSQGLVSASVLVSSDPGGMTSASLAKIFQYIKYLNVTYSAKLELMFKSKNSSTGFLPFTPPMSNEMKQIFVARIVPYRFATFKVHSSFLVNFWDGLVCLGLLFALWSLVRIFEFVAFALKKRVLPYSLFSKVRAIIQNFLITQFYSSYGDIMIFSALELRTAKIDSPAAGISVGVSIFFLALICVVIWIHISIITSYQRRKKKPKSSEELEAFNKMNEGYKVIYLNFKDGSFLHQSVLLVLNVRNLIFALIIVLLVEYPIVQITMITTSTVLMILYLFITRPFILIINLIQQLFGEIIFFVVNVCVIGLTILDISRTDKIELRNSMSQVIIICNMVLTSVSPVFIVAKALHAAWEFYKSRKAKKQDQSQKQTQSHSIHISLDNSIPHQTQNNISGTDSKIEGISKARPGVITKLELSNLAQRSQDISVKIKRGIVNTFLKPINFADHEFPSRKLSDRKNLDEKRIKRRQKHPQPKDLVLNNDSSILSLKSHHSSHLDLSFDQSDQLNIIGKESGIRNKC